MTLEEIKEAVEVIKAYRQMLTDSVSNQIDGDIKAFDVAVEAMERESCGDCVSRQAVEAIINDIRDCISVEGYCAIVERMKKLPSVNPQRMGHWIEDTNGTYTDNHDTWECSQCGHAQILLEGTPKDNDYNYCPNCGAKMVEPQESEGKE